MLNMIRNTVNSYFLSCNLFDILIQELRFHESSNKYLSRKEILPLFRRYSSWIVRQEFFRHLYAQRLKNLVEYIVKSPHPTMLDAGCGLGSESLLCGLLGAKVTGVDLSNFRITIANKRRRYFEDKLQRKIDVVFEAKNIFTYDSDQKFDVIFVREAISHVYPLPAFFRAIRNRAKPSSLVIIIDANPLNPYQAIKAWLAHRHRLIYYLPDPEGKEKIPYVNERLVHTSTLRRMRGFNVDQINYHGFFPFYIPFVNYVEELANKVPVLKLVGVSYEIIGRFQKKVTKSVHENEE